MRLIRCLLYGFNVDYSGFENARGPYSYLQTWNWPITAHKISQPHNKNVNYRSPPFQFASPQCKAVVQSVHGHIEYWTRIIWEISSHSPAEFCMFNSLLTWLFQGFLRKQSSQYLYPRWEWRENTEEHKKILTQPFWPCYWKYRNTVITVFSRLYLVSRKVRVIC